MKKQTPAFYFQCLFSLYFFKDKVNVLIAMFFSSEEVLVAILVDPISTDGD